jgi:hypothetical protein
VVEVPGPDGTVVSLNISPAKINPDAPRRETLPALGFMLDADISKTGSQSIEGVRRLLNSSTSWAEETLPTIAAHLFPERSRG